MIHAVSAVGKVAYRAAARTGLAAGEDKPPYPCALPLRVVEGPDDNAKLREVAGAIFDAARDLLHSPAHVWRRVAFTDPDGEDLFLQTKPPIGAYNFARASMSFRGATPALFLDTVHGDRFDFRQEYSSELVGFDILARPTPEITIQYQEYRAPPPIRNRYLIYLVEKRYLAEEDTWYVYGCSIDYPSYKVTSNAVSSICMWTWELSQVGHNTIATYASCMSPNAWVPPFIINWMKSAIGKELVAIRRFLYRQRPQPQSGISTQPQENLVEVNSNKKEEERVTDDSSSDREANCQILTDNSTLKMSELDNSEDDSQFKDNPLQEDAFFWRHLEESEELQLL
ncbi:unnamed protein product [Phytomonas sp. Hart1]|nr:unnamed protein product [Phytomonas sp. Hart1]|eukprot:CCW67632.1 unnamed protein product [Phytomonas sp. isolate Hart1]